MGKAEVLEVIYRLVVNTLETDFEILGVLELLVVVGMGYVRLAALQGNKLLVLEEVGADFWVGLLNRLFYLCVAVIELEEFKRAGFFGLKAQELLDEDDFVELPHQFMTI